ncbi:LD-carboxypeptidase [Candidatus Saccharibacteria bacterium]|nr:LD-carboxypeptidase [Candidatus Saccharibacteria bacterium]
MKTFAELNKLSPGDQVAVISPSNGLPQIFPHVFDLGLKRLEDEFGLIAKEYPTTRIMGAPLKDRARDVNDAFADKDNKAVFTSIGGEDQIKLIKFLDPEVIRNNPKPFIGYSDNTQIHNFLWNLGIPSYYGGAIMTQFGMQGNMDDLTVKFIKKALFEGGNTELEVSDEYNDIGLDWNDTQTLSQRRHYEPNDGLFWNGSQNAEGVLWGGCLESLVYQTTVDKYLPSANDLEGTILFLETAEDIPEHWLVEYLVTGFGERGWFDKFKGVLVGRPKAWEFDKPNSTDAKLKYRAEQRETILKVVREYNKDIPVVQNIDCGHTDPQILLPMGRKVSIDTSKQKIILNY